MNRGAWWATVHGVTESDRTERLSTATRDEYIMSRTERLNTAAIDKDIMSPMLAGRFFTTSATWETP